MTKFVVRRGFMGLAQLACKPTKFRAMLVYARDQAMPSVATGFVRFQEWRRERNHAQRAAMIEHEAQQFAEAHPELFERNAELLAPLTRGVCPIHGTHEHILGEDGTGKPAKPTIQ